MARADPRDSLDQRTVVVSHGVWLHDRAAATHPGETVQQVARSSRPRLRTPAQRRNNAFDVINYYGSCAAALVYNHRRMGAKMDRVIAALQRKLAREPEGAFYRGMQFPTRWDPFFKDYMTLEDVYRYPGQHFDFHKHQLALNSAAD